MGIDEMNDIYEEFADYIADNYPQYSWRETAWRDRITGEEGAKICVIEKGLYVRFVEVTKKEGTTAKLQYWFVKNQDQKVDVTSLEQLLSLI